MKTRLLTINTSIFFSFFGYLAIAQQPLQYSNINHLGSYYEENILDLETDNEYNVYALVSGELCDYYYNDSLIDNNSSTMLLKISPSGNLLFYYSFKVQGDDCFIDIREIGFINDNIIIPGGFYGTLQFGDTTINHESPQGFICKLSKDGIPGTIHSLNISEGYSIARHMAIDEGNYIYFAGASVDSIFFNQNNDTIHAPIGTYKIPLFKFDQNFNLQWLKIVYCDYSLVGEHPISIDNDNNIILASRFHGSTLYFEDQIFETPGELKMLFAKFSSSGELLWANTAQGYFQAKNYLICTDDENNIYFSTEFNDTIIYNSIIIKPSMNYHRECLLLALNGDGEFNWFNTIRDITSWPVFITPNDLKIKNDFIFLGGYYKTNSYFGEIYVPSITNGYDSFITKMDKETGVFIWAQGLPGNNISNSDWLSFDFGEGNNIYFSSQFSGEVTFGNEVLTSYYGNPDLFFAKLKETYVGLDEQTEYMNVSIFPNPGSQIINIKTDNTDYLFHLYNSKGQILFEKQLKNFSSITVNTNSIPQGLYIYKITGKDGIAKVGKWVKNH